MDPYTRVRQRGFTNRPLLHAQVRQWHTWYPEEGWHEMERLSDNDGLFHESESSASWIADLVHGTKANSRGIHTIPHPVDHIKVVSSSLSSKTVSWELPPYINQMTLDVRGYAPGGNGSLTSDAIVPPPPTDVVSRFSNQCLDEMTTAFPPAFDALSFVVELKDLASTMDTLFDIANAVKKLRERSFSIRQAARIHAGYNFGVSPILGDTAKLFNTYNRVKRRVEWLLANAEKWVRVGSSSGHSVDEDVFVGGWGYSGWTPGVALVRTHRTYSLRATARARFKRPDVSGWLLHLRTVIGDMSMDKPLSSFWELVPFSWLVDYFVPISGWLKSITHVYDPTWDVRDPCWSSRGHYVYRAPFGFDDGHGGRIELASLGGFVVQRYTRYPGLPPWDWSILDPSPKQLSLLAAVAWPQY